MNSDFEKMTKEEKDKWLFEEQKQTLDMFLKRNAITKEQYNKSFRELIKVFNVENM